MLLFLSIANIGSNIFHCLSESSMLFYKQLTCQKRLFGQPLVELLVVILIISVLASVAISAVRSVREHGDRVVGVSNLRQIGIAIKTYASDHDGVLPGRLFPGQVAVTGKPERLCQFLASYLGVSDGQSAIRVVPAFVPPAYRRVGISINDGRTYVMNMSMPLADGGTHNPWGSAVDPLSGSGPQPFVSIQKRTWMMSDADKQHPRVANAAWKSFTPDAPIHGPRRQALISDGSVAVLETDELR
jgi:type II secretory pathway pseudopilin PulG